MTRPVRIRQLRKARASIQRTSMQLNGLPAKSVARPSKFGNPFNWQGTDDADCPESYRKGAAVDMFREWLYGGSDEAAAYIANAVKELPGHNLACYCKPDEPCHADVLLAYLRLEGV